MARLDELLVVECMLLEVLGHKQVDIVEMVVAVLVAVGNANLDCDKDSV